MSRGKLLVAAAAIAAAIGAYALAGFYGVPRLVRSKVPGLFAEQYGRSAELGEVRFNPFTFEFETLGLSIPDADGERMLGFDRLYVDFEVASLWNRAWTFREISIDRPYGRIVQRADGSINVMDLAPPDTGPPPVEEEPTGIPSIRIGHLGVAAGRLDVEDRARPQPFGTTFAPVTFELSDFRTSGSGNAFAFAAGSDLAGRLSLEGGFAVEPLSSQGSVKVAGLQATAISEYLGELLPVELRAGVIDLGFTYDFSLAGEPFTFVLDMPSLAVRGLSTQGRGYDVPWLFQEIDVRGTRVDLAARSVVVQSVTAKGIEAPVWLDANGFHAPGALGLLVQTSAQGADAAGAAAAAPAPAAGEEGPEWTVSVPVMELQDASLPFEDRSLRTPARIALVLDSAKIEGFALPETPPLKVQASLASGAGGRLSAGGTVRLEPMQASLEVAVEALNLTPVQPYLQEDTDLLFDSGRLTARGKLELETGDPPDFTFEGSLTVADLRTRDRPLAEDFIKWQSLEVSGIRYGSSPARLSITEIVARQPYMRLILAENGVSNIESVLDPEAAAAKAAAVAAEREAARTRKGRDTEDEESAAEAEAAAAAGPEAPGMPVAIGRTRILDGSLNFADYTIEPNFRIAMEQLTGSIVGSSSDPAARSELTIDGRVDRYAPVHIAGRLNLLAPTSFVDIEAWFRNIELTSFNPYSTKFIGYQIDKGKLSIDTQYKVEDRRLTALHRIKLDQLEFGQKIDSPDAIGLPVKLAVALLKDSKGVIDLDLPIGGSIDDPKFKVGPIIWKAVVGLLTKIVTAPFALLGSLFGGGEDLSFIDFAAGSAALDAAGLDKVATLRRALTERPNLRLDIPWTAAPGIDRPALEQARWEAAVRAAGGTGGAPAEAWRTDREEYLRRLHAMYTQKNGRKPELPRPPKPAEGEPRPDPVEFAIGLLEPELRAGVTVGEDDLASLGQARADAVRDALLAEGGLDASRVFVVRGEEAETLEGGARMKLSLE